MNLCVKALQLKPEKLKCWYIIGEILGKIPNNTNYSFSDLWMVYRSVVGASGLEYGGREFESRSLRLKPETELREESGLSGCRKGLNTVSLAQALLSLKLPQTKQFLGLNHVPIAKYYQ